MPGFHKEGKLPTIKFDAYLFYLCLLSEVLSLIAQITYAYNFLLSKGFEYLKEDQSRFLAAILYLIVIFVLNDGAKILSIIYINKFIESITGKLLLLENLDKKTHQIKEGFKYNQVVRDRIVSVKDR
jgi:hypothetical protein